MANLKLGIAIGIALAAVVPNAVRAAASNARGVTCDGPRGSSLLAYDFSLNGAPPVPNLGGNTKSGNRVTATFTIPDGCTTQFSLVAYTAPGPKYRPETVDQQRVYQQATGTWTGGQHSLTVTAPNCFFQLDFVRGGVIMQEGPVGSANFYGSRLISAADSGTQACNPPKPPTVPIKPAPVPLKAPGAPPTPPVAASFNLNLPSAPPIQPFVMPARPVFVPPALPAITVPPSLVPYASVQSAARSTAPPPGREISRGFVALEILALLLAASGFYVFRRGRPRLIRLGRGR